MGHGGKNSSLEMGHGRKNSHIVGKIPTWSEKKTGRGIHEGIINQVILFKFPYMSCYLILSNYNSILSFSVTCHTCQPSMSLSFCPFVLVRLYVLPQLYPLSYLICTCFFSTFMTLKISLCSDGLVVRVEVKGSLVQVPAGAVSFENQGSKFSPWEQEYDRKNSDMVGKFRPWEQENRRKKISLSGRKKKSSITWIIQYCGTRPICRDSPIPFLSVCLYLLLPGKNIQFKTFPFLILAQAIYTYLFWQEVPLKVDFTR